MMAAISLAVGATPARATTGAGDTAGLDLSAYRGKVVMVEFWASWCAPCRLSFPFMQRMKEIYARDGLVIVAVNVDHSRARADGFLNGLPHDFRIVYDANGAIAGKYKVNEMPTSILIGRDGRPRVTHYGYFDDKALAYEADIMELVNEK